MTLHRALGIGLGVGLSLLLSAAVALDSTPKPQGKPVTLRFGPGFSETGALAIQLHLESKGCPTTMTPEGGVPMHIIVEVDGKKTPPISSIGSASATAEDMCLEKGTD